jgi:hypothetical protein
MGDVPEDLLLDVGALRGLADLVGAGDLVGQLITARLLAIGFELACYDNATAFLRELRDLSDAAAGIAKRKRLN